MNQMMYIINPMESPSNEFKVDRSAFSVVSREEAQKQDIAYWHSKTPLERLEALELMRQSAYGYDPAVMHIEKVLEIVKKSF
jgi:hypothetical protein